MKMKYIMFECDGGKLPVLFPEFARHDNMVDGSMAAFCRVFDEVKPVSAGFFVATEKDGVCCYGKSESLKLEWASGDATIIQRALDNQD